VAYREGEASGTLPSLPPRLNHSATPNPDFPRSGVRIPGLGGDLEGVGRGSGFHDSAPFTHERGLRK
jgi:hypothetical protein